VHPFSQLANALIRQKYLEEYKGAENVPEAKQKIFLRIGTWHKWFGRFLLAAMIVNGGLGFAFADQLPKDGRWTTTAPRVTYGVLATVIAMAYILLVVGVGEIRRDKRPQPEPGVGADSELQAFSQQGAILDASRPQTAETVRSEHPPQGAFKSTAL
jgi:hypothetical protein